MHMESTETHLLDDIEYIYVQAGAGQRFVNYLVDRVVFFLVWRALSYITVFPLTMFLYTATGGNQPAILVIYLLIAMALFVLWNTAFEAFTGGKSLGKLITRTRAVTENGTRITFRNALLRSLCRCIPFEAFSAFGTPTYPWHDRLSKTLVVDEKLTQLPPWS
jgi:uncharacterized RDD family membrane protein YckC